MCYWGAGIAQWLEHSLPIMWCKLDSPALALVHCCLVILASSIFHHIQIGFPPSSKTNTPLSFCGNSGQRATSVCVEPSLFFTQGSLYALTQSHLVTDNFVIIIIIIIIIIIMMMMMMMIIIITLLQLTVYKLILTDIHHLHYVMLFRKVLRKYAR